MSLLLELFSFHIACKSLPFEKTKQNMQVSCVGLSERKSWHFRSADTRQSSFHILVRSVRNFELMCVDKCANFTQTICLWTCRCCQKKVACFEFAKCFSLCSHPGLGIFQRWANTANSNLQMNIGRLCPSRLPLHLLAIVSHLFWVFKRRDKNKKKKTVLLSSQLLS